MAAVALEGASRLADDHDLLVEDERRRADVAHLEARAARDKAEERAAADKRGREKQAAAKAQEEKANKAEREAAAKAASQEKLRDLGLIQ